LLHATCYRYGDTALNCFVDSRDHCSVGVRQTVNGKLRVTHAFGYTICTTIGSPRSGG
jgi:hypothetical protein